MKTDESPLSVDQAHLDVAAARHGVVLAVLFGSHAKGRARDHSDVDVGVLVENRSSHPENWDLELEAELCRVFPGRDVDLTVLNEASALLRFEAARTGRALYERTPGAFSRFRRAVSVPDALMTGSVAAIIRQQTVALGTYVEELRPFVSSDVSSYHAQPGYRRATERMIQVIVECAIDTAETVVEANGKPPTATAREAFETLETLDVLDAETATLFGRRYVGLRNRIVHDYESLDSGRVREGGLGLLSDAPRFARQVVAWLDRQ